MSFAKYSDIHFNNMESMVSSSIQKYQIQTASTKEPNLFYKLMVSKVIAKLKEMLFDPDFVNCNDQKKNADIEKSSEKPEYGDGYPRIVSNVCISNKSKVNAQLQVLLKKRIAVKNKRFISGGEIRSKIRKLSPKDDAHIYESPEFNRNNSFTLLIPVHCFTKS